MFMWTQQQNIRLEVEMEQLFALLLAKEKDICIHICTLS